ncbi:LOW QUALITY PROTEIN: protein furry homolog [Acropora millepora]|uniref:LOW QUALITY PROTEIN: protein furry homolog n=1 Tax=Acropora millepora TaxID=45264 RepID=UPI001CF31676|nr:LOW QUALITY PROTEIN: protein furry homolog [Acropora millepora]
MADFENREDEKTSSAVENGFVLPWGQPPDRQTSTTCSDVTPGEFVLRTLFSEFTVLAERKIETVLSEPLERPLSKSLQRGEDPQFDQLLNSLQIVAEYSLPSLLKALFKWYEKQQNKIDETDGQKGKVTITRPKGGSESPKMQSKFHINKDHLTERRDLAVDFLFCLVLIEVLKQLPVHPVDDEFIQYMLSLAFRNFKQRDSVAASPTASNHEIIAALYAEVLGVLAHACFLPVRKRFIAEFKEHQNNTSSFVNIIYGMKYLRIKLFPVEELEESFNFMRECATLFIDSKDKEVKHAFALMFVEILLPVAAGANRELNVPAIKGFVDQMYHHTFDLTKKTRHSQAIYPLVTVLLCVSQKSFFLGSWPSFLSMCLGALKQRDVKMQKVAMECLYRLVWVYMVRIKGESNTATVARLRSITEVLFPRNARAVIPREAPLNYFVKIIQFISQEKLDFAIHDIIFDLLSIGRTSRQMCPERMNIGLRAFFVIADGLQRKGSETPAMPTSTTPLPSGNTVKVRRVASMNNLTEAQASSIGLANCYHSIRKALDSIIRALDVQVGKPMMMSNPHCSLKEHEEIAASSGERNPKVDPKIELFRTCIAAIPRCIPEGMTKMELVDLLSRLTVHMDEELRGLALSSLQSFVLNFSDWRENTILGFINVILREIQDNLPSLLDSALRMLLQLLGQWKTALTAGSANVQSDKDLQLELSAHNLPHDKEIDRMTVLHNVEGFALVMLCSIHPVIRKLALLVLKEVRTLGIVMNLSEKEKAEKVVLDVIEEVFPTVLEKVLHSVPQSEKLFSGPLGNADIFVVNERLSGNMDKETGEQLNVSLHNLFWSSLVAGLLNKYYLPELCPSAIQFSWPSVFNRLVTVYALIDSGASGIDSITSLSSFNNRGPKKTMNVNHVCLFRNYLIFACCAYPHPPPQRSDSSEQDGGASLESAEPRADSRPPSPSMVDSLFRFAVPLLKSDVSDVREAVIIGLGRTSPCSYREFLEEVQFLLRECLERRAESVRRKRKRDVLRAYLVRIFELNAEHGCFSDSASELLTEAGLSSIFLEYIEGTRCYLESESERDTAAVMQQRLHFALFLYKMITSVPVSRQRNLLPDDMRCSLFFLFSSWCAHFGVKARELQKAPLVPSAQSNDLEMASLHAMCALLQCGPVFDRNGLITGGYLYNWLQLVLNSPKEKIHQLGHSTLVHLLENNGNIPSLLHWVIDKCYTGSRLVVNGCFKALVSVFTKSDYPCGMIPILNVVLFKTADSSLAIRETAAQLLQLLERRFFPFTSPSLSCTSRCAYSQCQTTLSEALASAHPEITIHMFEEMTARFEMASPVGQRCILKYMLPWLSNIELVGVSNCSPSPPEVNIQTDEEEQTDLMSPVELEGEGWGSLEATQLVLNNLFYITVKYDEQFSKEIEEAWGSLCSRWANNIREILGYLIALAGIIGSSEVLVHAKKLAVYVARANQQKTIEELMEELKLTETVASQFERCDEPPYFRPLQKSSSSSDSVSDSPSGEGTGTLTKKSITKQDTTGKDDVNTEGEVLIKESREERKESREERRETKEERKEKGDSLPRGTESGLISEAVKPVENSVPLAEPEEVDQIVGQEKSEVAWAQEWIIMAHRLVGAGMALPLPVPEGENVFAALPDILPFAPYVASLYRCNFALMLLAELVLDQAAMDWEEHLPLMLHVIFLALDHGKALVYEHSKRLLINLIIVLVCRGNHVTLAQSLFNFITISEQGLGKHGLLKSSWTLDVGNLVGVSGPRAGAGTGTESVDGNIVSAGAGKSGTSAGSSSPEKRLPPEENSANMLVEQIQELIEFLANSDCKPLWAFEDITARSYKIKSAEQLELFVASVVQIFQASDSGNQVQEKMAKVALQWATSCSSRHYAGRSFQVFRALKVPLSWSMLSDVLSRLVESVGDASEDVQGYVMEILLTLETASDWTMVDHSNTSELKNDQDLSLGFYLDDEKDDAVDDYSLHMVSSGPLTRVRQGGHIRSLSSGCEFKRHSSLLNRFGRWNGSRDDPMLRAKSASVQCLLKTPSEAINPQSQADMVTRVFWIAVSLLESDYEHEFLMAIHLLNKVLSVLDLSCHDSQVKLEKVLHRLKWNDFPGLQALLLKGVTNAATSVASLHLLAKLTVFPKVSLVDPSQGTGCALNMLALLPYMLEHFKEPDEFCKTCAENFVQVCHGSGNLAHLSKLYEMYLEKTYHRPMSTWIDSVCRYINDSFAHLARSHITFLLEVLERGPTHYHQVVLGLLCSLMKYGDFSSPSMRQFQNDALKTISKYLKGNLWKESIDILKMAVSNSSHLDTPPPRPASSVWTVHDSSWSTEAMMIKKDLPGRTLDFTFDLSATPVIGRKVGSEFPGDLARENKVLSPGGTVDLSTWRKPHLSQRRTRERIVNVLTTCGHTVGLKQSPSVVFSSSSDLAVEKQGVGQQSSSEETSLTEGLSNDKGKDEMESQQISVLTNFDFLYDESEDVAWGPEYEDRRLSYCSLGGGSLERDLKSTLRTMECLSGSEPDLTPHDSSDDDDEIGRSLTTSALTAATAVTQSVLESSSESSANATVVPIGSDKCQEQGRESRSPSVDSSDSRPVASDTCNSYKLFAVTEITLESRGDAEKLWAAHVGSIVKDTTGVIAVNTFSLFSHLYESTRKKFYSLTRECCNYLAEEKFRDVTRHFLDTLDFLVSRGECPFVCFDTETLNQTKILERHKFNVLELDSHFSNYVHRSERTLECLDDVKFALKRSSVGSHLEETETRMTVEPGNQELRQVQLCRSMYKTHFQFLLLCSTYARLLESLIQAAHQAEVNDLSQEVSEIRRELSSILENPTTEESYLSKSFTGDEPLTKDAATQLLVEKLTEKETEGSIHLLRAFREKFGGDLFGESNEDNVECLVSIYCKHVAEKNIGSLVMSGPLSNFASLCKDLMEVNVAVLGTIEDLGT